MNVRQAELLRVLLSNDAEYFLVDQLAKRVHCSEKTIRNDLKIISDFLAGHSTLSLHRKPGYGIYLEGSDQERKELLLLMEKSQEKPSEERLFDTAYELLTADRPLTLQYFADQHFTNRTTVKKDLDELAKWLETFNINLVSKQKIGVYLEGDEVKKRSAFAQLPQLASFHEHGKDSITKLFPDSEVNIVKSALKRGNFYFTDETFDRLVIHILIMIKRIKQKKPIQIPVEKAVINEKETFSQVLALIKEIEPIFAMSVPESEVIYLARHFMSGKKRTADETDSPHLNRLVQGLITHMTDMTKIDFASDLTLIQGLTIHLQPVLHRITYQLPISNPLLAEIKRMYPYLFSMVMLALDDLQKSSSIILPEDEAAYIVLHFQASIERRKRMASQRKRAIIVCHHGIGMSHLLRSRIERHIPDLQIEHCISRAEIPDYMDHEFIISTIELPDVKIPHIVVSPLFDLADQDRLQSFLKHTETDGPKTEQYATLLRFIDEDLIILQVDLEHRYEVVEMLANSLYARGFVKKEYIHSALLRERMSATSIGSGIAMPHGSPSDIIQSGIAVAVLKEPLEWGSERVSLVFLLAVVHEDPQVIKKLFNEISFLSEQDKLVNELSKQSEKAAFIKYLKQ
ncbi:BglG family transcription antiterminator [Bacillus sp. FSL K6-3431]|uniref:BglG family transcription antiterminator n=1 Tax=Bacillus sp. FSL K6-3431 TaxID=2921500 RepID=UPI0030FAFA8D